MTTARPFFIVLFALSAACSPTVRIDSSVASSGPPQKAILLPIEVTTDMSREHADYIRRMVRSQLASKNYALLADDIVLSGCSSPACPEKPVLLDNYNADGAFALSIASFRRTNFLAGFYNTISGLLRLNSASNSELVSVEASESERGGLLFNTGQVLEGISSTLDNLEKDASVRSLGAKFAKRITDPVPQPKTDDFFAQIPADWQVEAKPVKGDLYEICALAPQGLMADLLLQGRRANLRRSGSAYCGKYLLALQSLNGANLIVELRSPFGAAVQKPVQLTAYGKRP